jgi:hypothetical protein
MRLVAWTSGNFCETTGPERLHGRRLWCHPLPAQCLHRPAGSMVEHSHTLGREGIGRRRFNHRGGKAHSHCRVKGVATAEEHAHTGHRCQIMAASHNPMRAPHYWSAGGAAYHFCMFLIVLSCHRNSPLWLSVYFSRSSGIGDL